MFFAALMSRSETTPTGGTRPPAHVEGKRVQDKPTGVAPLAAGIAAVNLAAGPPLPVGFVLHLAEELTPADIVNGLRQRRMLRHRLHTIAFTPSPSHHRLHTIAFTPSPSHHRLHAQALDAHR